MDDKWLATLQQRTHSELDRITQDLTTRVKELAEQEAIADGTIAATNNLYINSDVTIGGSKIKMLM